MPGFVNPYLPQSAEIVGKKREAQGIYTFRLRWCDETMRRSYRFQPGQFNMLYAFGLGEVPISIVSDPDDPECLDHTIRIAGEVTEALCRLKKGDRMGLRGPYGSAWPMEEAGGKDVIIVTGGLGCAPVVSVIQYVLKRRENYGKLKILHGIKTPKDLLYRDRFERWRRQPDTEVYLSSDQEAVGWTYSVGVVTNLFSRVEVDVRKSLVMMCGPEVMMRHAVDDLLGRGFQARQIYLSMERNMKCALGFCGHCQFGPNFLCKEGPVFRYDRIAPWFRVREI